MLFLPSLDGADFDACALGEIRAGVCVGRQRLETLSTVRAYVVYEWTNLVGV